jgi:NTP pyrophosphatase (non-canonical NTP hydrolase)
LISTFKRSSWTPSGYETTEYSSEYTITYTAEEAFEMLRAVRNRLLQQTDWRMVSDYPGSNQTEWQTYRQALRDITAQTPSLDADGNLTGITWPTAPTD